VLASSISNKSKRTTVERNGSHLLELINDILDVAKKNWNRVRSGGLLLPLLSIVFANPSIPFVKHQSVPKTDSD
jgi:hypothetical protein